MKLFGWLKKKEASDPAEERKRENEKKFREALGSEILVSEQDESVEEEVSAEIMDSLTEAPETEAKKKAESPEIAEQIFSCSGCESTFTIREMRKCSYVCPNCGKHHKISARRRVRGLVDPGTFRRLKSTVPFLNPLDYPEYKDKITALQEKTGLDEAVYSGVGEIEGHKCVVAVMGSEFLMGSMGIAVGEMITNTFEVGERLHLPVIIFTASGGARMQEGILSLMQMAKTSAAVKRFSENGGLYIAVLTHPTTGGVSASFATLADITLAEPGALIGFAGPRVIEQTIGQKLPEGFQKAEYLEEHGFVDEIVSRHEMRDKLAQLMRLHAKKRRPTL